MAFPGDLLVLSGMAGLLNPAALLIAAILGWFCDRGQKIWLASFIAALGSGLADTFFRVAGLDILVSWSGGFLAVLPVRMIGGGVCAALVMLARRRFFTQP